MGRRVTRRVARRGPREWFRRAFPAPEATTRGQGAGTHPWVTGGWRGGGRGDGSAEPFQPRETTTRGQGVGARLRGTGRVRRRGPGGWVRRAFPAPRDDDTRPRSGNASTGDRAGEAVGAGGMGPQSPSRPARRRHSGQGVGTSLRVTGTESAVVGGPIPPAPAASPARRARFEFEYHSARQEKLGITRLASRSICFGSSDTGPRTRYSSPAPTRSAMRALIRSMLPAM